MASSTEEDLDSLCKEILQLDNSIRFAGIANNLGSLVATAYRKELIPLMDKQETSHYAIQAVLRAATREDFESKIGRLEYSIGKYERLIRATIPIPIRLFGKEDDESKFYYLLLSFDLKFNIMDVIENKVYRLYKKIDRITMQPLLSEPDFHTYRFINIMKCSISYW